LKIETERRSQSGPENEEGAEHNSHMRQDRGHSESSSSNNYTGSD
jgi:hypothetical protein